MIITGKDIARGLRRAYMAMNRQTQRLLAPCGITAEQYVVIALLQLQDGCTQKELAQRASSDPNTIRAILILMENNGLVAREVDKTDLRARKIRLTAKGRQLYCKAATAIKPLQDAMLCSIGARDADQFVNFLNRIEDGIHQWD